MAAKTKATPHKKPVVKITAKQPIASPTLKQTMMSQMHQSRTMVRQRVSAFLARRPHRSFRRTMKRDYIRSLDLPGYWAFTNTVRATLWESRRLFIWVIIIYAVLSGVLVGLASQDSYTALSDTLKATRGEIFEGNWGEISKASLLFATSITGSITTSPTEAQQIYAALVVLLSWLTTVWLLRAVKAGQKPRFRDGLYNAGAPIVSTTAVSFVLLIQLIPAALAVIAFGAAASSGFLQGGVESMLFSVVALLLIVLSIYWVTSTMIALTVVTLPGMYPMQALRTAGDLVIGRRLRILLRWVWLTFLIIVTWALVMIPIIIFDTWLKSILPAIQWVPIVPVALLGLSSITVVAVAAYVYLLYRKVVEDDAAPA